MFRSFTLFRAFGIPIRIDLGWLLVFALVTWSLSAEILPSDALVAGAGLGRASIVALSLATSLLFFASIALHELGHAIAALRSGLPIRSVTLFVFGGVAELAREPDRPDIELKVAVAGPAVSLGLAALFATFGFLVGSPPLPAPACAAAKLLAIVNTGLIAFNLFPGFPLDGGRVLRAALWAWKGSLRRATHAAARIGGGFGAVLVALGLIEFVSPHGSVFSAIWIALIGLFVRRAAQASYRQVLVRTGLDGVRVCDLMRPPEAAVASDMPIERFATEHVLRHRCDAFPVLEGGAPVGLVLARDVGRLRAEERTRATVASIMRPDCPPGYVAPDTDAFAALEAMRDRPLLVVCEDGVFRGLVVRRDLLEAARLRADMAIF